MTQKESDLGCDAGTLGLFGGGGGGGGFPR